MTCTDDRSVLSSRQFTSEKGKCRPPFLCPSQDLMSCGNDVTTLKAFLTKLWNVNPWFGQKQRKKELQFCFSECH